MHTTLARTGRRHWRWAATANSSAAALMLTRSGRLWIGLGVSAAPLAPLTLTVSAQERDRSKIPDKYKWNLADIYPSDAAWRAAKDKLSADIPSLALFRGRLASSSATLADALDKLFSLNKELSRLASYASLFADQDTRDSHPQGLRQEM